MKKRNQKRTQKRNQKRTQKRNPKRTQKRNPKRTQKRNQKRTQKRKYFKKKIKRIQVGGIEWDDRMLDGLKQKNLIFERLLGEGSSGHVIEVKDNNDGKFYAIKIQEKCNVDYFELDIISKISGCNVGVVTEYWGFDEWLYAKMPFFGRGELFLMIEKGIHPFDGRKMNDFSRRMIIHILNQVKCIHSNGVAHRDLKLENIVVGDDNIPHLIDFGDAEEFQCSLGLWKIKGTAQYIAPEVINKWTKTDELSSSYDVIKADIYSLGIILYVVATVTYPRWTEWRGFGGIDTRPKRLNVYFNLYSNPKKNSPSDLIKLEKTLTEYYNREIANLIMLALSFDPDKRPSVNDLILSFKGTDTHTRQKRRPCSPPDASGSASGSASASGLNSPSSLLQQFKRPNTSKTDSQHAAAAAKAYTQGLFQVIPSVPDAQQSVQWPPPDAAPQNSFQHLPKAAVTDLISPRPLSPWDMAAAQYQPNLSATCSPPKASPSKMFVWASPGSSPRPSPGSSPRPSPGSSSKAAKSSPF
jgi:serine/threonine protein kinase